MADIFLKYKLQINTDAYQGFICVDDCYNWELPSQYSIT
ncbi:hypothetical protein NSP_11790 [Nodularia spumigena CCY9414]|nr:hypothetical protein NSP_11790 [Nodularia spumigena CCY9414]